MNADNDSGSQTSDKKSHSTQAVVAVVVAVIAALATIVAAVITSSKDPAANTGSSTVASTQRTPSSPPPSPSPESVTITHPTPGQGVIGHKGVQLKGTAQNLDGKRLRIFDFADNHKYYLLTAESVPVTNDAWSFFDPQVGSSTPDDNGHAFTLVVTLTDPSCDGTLDTATPNAEGDIVFTALPTGCRELASVKIVKQS